MSKEQLENAFDVYINDQLKGIWLYMTIEERDAACAAFNAGVAVGEGDAQ